MYFTDFLHLLGWFPIWVELHINITDPSLSVIKGLFLRISIRSLIFAISKLILYPRKKKTRRAMSYLDKRMTHDSFSSLRFSRNNVWILWISSCHHNVNCEWRVEENLHHQILLAYFVFTLDKKEWLHSTIKITRFFISIHLIIFNSRRKIIILS